MMNRSVEPHNSSIGDIQANTMALLFYFVGSVLVFIPIVRYVAWLAPLVIFFMEKESGFVKFHAMQSFVLNAIGVALGLLVSMLFGGIFAATLSIPMRRQRARLERRRLWECWRALFRL